ncbi:MAG: hypothetical protein ND866_23140, partial [Pyrinomonadaceae bacterium]|nr:hypothetical protein [Pyrinomonadaceae bacterium]
MAPTRAALLRMDHTEQEVRPRVRSARVFLVRTTAEAEVTREVIALPGCQGEEVFPEVAGGS